jgi:dCTP deaminase
MILCDREVQAARARGAVILDPCPPAESDRWSPTTLDLTLDAEIRPWTGVALTGEQILIDPVDEAFSARPLIERHTPRRDCGSPGGFIIEPGELVLGWTVERLALPPWARIAARVEGKSSLARVGLGIHVTAPTIHPGFGYAERQSRRRGSPIQLEIWNIGRLRIKLTRGMRICQIIFEEVHGTPSQGYRGQFQVQGPQPRRPSRRRRPPG